MDTVSTAGLLGFMARMCTHWSQNIHVLDFLLVSSKTKHFHLPAFSDCGGIKERTKGDRSLKKSTCRADRY